MSVNWLQQFQEVLPATDYVTAAAMQTLSVDETSTAMMYVYGPKHGFVPLSKRMNKKMEK